MHIIFSRFCFQNVFTRKLIKRAKSFSLQKMVQGIRNKSMQISNKSEIAAFKDDPKLNLKALERKREVYNDFIKSLGLFIAGRNNDEQKQIFLDSYAALWLWAPDEVISVINIFFDLQMKATSGQVNNQQVLKDSYAACIISLRNDCGVRTVLKSSDYRYVFFGK